MPVKETWYRTIQASLSINKTHYQRYTNMVILFSLAVNKKFFGPDFWPQSNRPEDEKKIILNINWRSGSRYCGCPDGVEMDMTKAGLCVAGVSDQHGGHVPWGHDPWCPDGLLRHPPGHLLLWQVSARVWCQERAADTHCGTQRVRKSLL